ncbi:hypothetical protein GCK32_009722 [Trichostrongylus colubriformis]|uniref:Uncharacterized protein n=1 Tax=Trichostrongylus colubriformis TaxID=6319 RepID=A0AAN8ESA8_TRICO
MACEPKVLGQEFALPLKSKREPQQDILDREIQTPHAGSCFSDHRNPNAFPCKMPIFHSDVEKRIHGEACVVGRRFIAGHNCISDFLVRIHILELRMYQDGADEQGTHRNQRSY